MDPHPSSRDSASQADDRAPPSLPYPLTRGDVGFWLQRGEQLGRAAWWIAATVAAGHKRAATWRRQMANKPTSAAAARLAT